jgi:hypothetical protein
MYGGGWNRILPYGMLACAATLIGRILREEAPAQSLILAVLVIVLISVVWLWLSARRR